MTPPAGLTAVAITRLFDESALEPVLLRLVEGAADGAVFQLVALATAMGVGAVHAIGPGHGKTLIGAYLAGSDGRPRDAVALGGLVALMHTGSVLALGTAFYATQRVPGSERLQAALTLASALAITAVGVVLLVRRRGGRAAALRRPVTVAGGSGTGGEPDGAGHRHHHELPEGVAPLSRAGVAALATSGGLLPAPAAFLVLATSFSMGRSGYGLALVGAFSTGLAVTLTALGLAVLWGRSSLHRHRERRRVLAWASSALPTAAAVVVLVGGLVLAASALLRL